jgi:hypothetical protein
MARIERQMNHHRSDTTSKVNLTTGTIAVSTAAQVARHRELSKPIRLRAEPARLPHSHVAVML